MFIFVINKWRKDHVTETRRYYNGNNIYRLGVRESLSEERKACTKWNLTGATQAKAKLNKFSDRFKNLIQNGKLCKN